jgi:C-terminal processing protease CtpA/Prc
VKTIQPVEGQRPFLGPVVVLVGPRTLSAAEDFLIPLHASHRATLVGQRTAGSTGQPLIIMLPGGGGAAICTKWDSYPDGREFVGVGIDPDVEVYPTQAEVAAGLWSGGKDPVLERGAAVLREKLRGR